MLWPYSILLCDSHPPLKEKADAMAWSNLHARSTWIKILLPTLRRFYRNRLNDIYSLLSIFHDRINTSQRGDDYYWCKKVTRGCGEKTWQPIVIADKTIGDWITPSPVKLTGTGNSAFVERKNLGSKDRGNQPWHTTNWITGDCGEDKCTYILVLVVIETVVPLEDKPPPVPDVVGWFICTAGWLALLPEVAHQNWGLIVSRSLLNAFSSCCCWLVWSQHGVRR